MNIINIFPIPIAKFKLERQLTQDEKNHLINLDIKPNKENFITLDSYVLEHKKCKI
jgi:hypothetical protein